MRLARAQSAPLYSGACDLAGRHDSDLARDHGRAGERLKKFARQAIVCSNCGYNLTGLREARCPECSSQFTLDEVLAAQPSAEGQELEGP